MKKQSIVLGFSRYKDGPLGVKARTIISRMTGNSSFPDPSPTLDDVALQADAYDAALQGIDGSAAAHLVFVRERSAMELILKHLGWHVLLHGNDDPVILESSGFDLTSGDTARGSDSAITGFRVDRTKGGDIRLKCDGFAGVRMYQFQYTLGPVTEDSEWTTINGSRSAMALEGLESGHSYAFRMGAFDRANRLVLSDVIVRFVGDV